MSLSFESFGEAREKQKPLKEIQEEIRNASKEERAKLSNEVIEALHKGLKIVSNDTLDYLKVLTERGNRIFRTNQKEADLIHAGDIIKIEGNKIFKNGKEIGLVEGFKTGNPKVGDSKTIKEKSNPQKNNPRQSRAKTQKQAPQKPKSNNPETENKPVLNPIYTSRDREKGDHILSENESNEFSSINKQVGYIEEGIPYIIGEKGEAQVLGYENFTFEYKNQIKQYEVALKKVKNFELLMTALAKNKPNDKEIKQKMQSVQETINSFNPNDLDNSIYKIQSSIQINLKGIKRVEKIDIDSEISVLNYIRKYIGDYELVEGIIAEKVFNEYSNISEEEYDDFLNNHLNPSEKIKNIFGKDIQKFQKKITKKKAEAENYYIKFSKEIEKENPNITIEEKDQTKDMIMNTFLGGYGKSLLIEKLIEDKECDNFGYTGTNEYLKLFSDIRGIGLLDFSDKTFDWSYEAFKFIAVEIIAIVAGAVTMGAGTAAVNALVYGSRGIMLANKIYKTGKYANRAIKGAKLTEKAGIMTAKTGRWAANSIIQGSGFYAGYGAIQSIKEGESKYSWEGLGESILFAGAFNGMQGLFKFLKIDLVPGKPLREQKIKITSQIATEGIGISALGFRLEGTLFEPGERNASTIYQAFIMVLGFRAAGILTKNLKFKQTQNGERVEVYERIHTYKKNGHEFMIGDDGKYYKIIFKEDNGKKIIDHISQKPTNIGKKIPLTKKFSEIGDIYIDKRTGKKVIKGNDGIYRDILGNKLNNQSQFIIKDRFISKTDGKEYVLGQDFKFYEIVNNKTSEKPTTKSQQYQDELIPKESENYELSGKAIKDNGTNEILEIKKDGKMYDSTGLNHGMYENIPTNIKTKNIKIEEVISSYENKRFAENIAQKLLLQKDVTITSKGKTITIEKLDNKKYQITGDGIPEPNSINPLKNLKSDPRIPPNFKVDYLNKLNFDSTIEYAKNNNGITLLKKWGVPFTGEYKISKDGTRLEYKNNGKWESTKDTGKIKKILSKPEVRLNILKQRFDKLNLSDFKEIIKVQNGMKEWIGGMTDASLMYMFQRLKALGTSGIMGGTFSVIIEIFFSGADGETWDAKRTDLIKSFLIGAAGGMLISVSKTGVISGFKVVTEGAKIIWKPFSIAKNFFMNHKLVTSGLVTAGGTVWYFCKNTKPNKDINNNLSEDTDNDETNIPQEDNNFNEV